jgi:uncharacterized protein
MRPIALVTAAFLAAAVILTLVLYARDPRLPMAGWRVGVLEGLKMVPMLILALVLARLAQSLVSAETMQRWLGAESGWRGIWIGCAVGALTPGGPATSFPIVAGLYQAGAGIGTLVAFVTAWSLWALTRLPVEVALINWRFAAIRLACTFFVPPLAGLLAHVFFARTFK